jgi:VWFA-related protein
MGRVLLCGEVRRFLQLFASALLGGILCACIALKAQAQTSPAPPQAPVSATSPAAQESASKAQNEEIVSHDSPATFKVRVSFVFVRVIVRDSNNKVITNLNKEDFQLADNRKLQIISTFAVETPGSHVATVKMDADSGPAPSEGTPVQRVELPQRFIALFFDDLHLSTKDALLSRQAATKLLGAMQAGERLAIFTTSGQVHQDFTADRGKLDETLRGIVPRPLTNHGSMDCPPMTLYEAYQIEEVHDDTALRVATDDTAACMGVPQGAAVILAEEAARRELSTGEAEMQFSFRNVDALIDRMKSLPGQRIIVLMSPGFFVTPSMHQTGDIIDRATKANIVINTIDARGLYVSSMFDVSADSLGANPGTSPIRAAFITTEESVQADILGEFADGTGGTFFHNRNDIDQGLLQAAQEPEVSYLLGFTPQNLKLDGKYHHLKVTLTGKQKWNLQARHGYFAPRGNLGADEAAKEEIRQAVYSQEEMQDLRLECQTQFFKDAKGARLAVVAHITTKGLKFARAVDRSKDKLTVATAIFDENGNLVTGVEKIIEMQLRDITLERLNRSGLSVKSTFDVQPGTFLVRIVVRDSEGAQMAAMNRGVVIPF